MENLLNEKQVAEKLGVSKSWVQRDRTEYGKGILPYIKIARHIRYKASDIESIIQQGRSTSNGEDGASNG